MSVGVLLGLMVATSAHALDPSRRISQYAHSAWRIQDGFFGSSPYALAQTADGYLWVGTQNGLLRFDGIRFSTWIPPEGKRLASTQITALQAARDGSLWIGTQFGLSHWSRGDLIGYPDQHGRINAIVEDRQGTIWIAQADSTNAAPFCEVTGARLRCYGKNEGVPPITGVALADAPDGSLWIGGESVLHRKSGAITTYPRSGVNARMGGVMAMALAPSGTLWVAFSQSGPGLGLQQLTNGEWTPVVTPALDSSTMDANTILLDRDNTLWIGRETGISRIRGNEIDHFGAEDGLSSNGVVAFYQDREGTMWVATSEGLDSFRDLNVTTFSIREGLTTNGIQSVVASRDGAIWIGGAGALNNLRNGNITALRGGKELPGAPVTSLLEDRAGQLWVGVDRRLMLYANGRFRAINGPDGGPIGLVVGLAEDRHGSIWAEISASPRKLVRIDGREVREEFPAPSMPEARRVAADPSSGLWLGLFNGDLARVRPGALERIPFGNSAVGSLESAVSHLVVNADGTVLGATPSGLIGWRNGTSRTLTRQHGLPCRRIFTFTTDRAGDLWLYAECGLIQIAKAQLDAWWRQPDVTVQTRVLDALDGVRPGYAPFVAAATSADGRLWFANGTVLQMVDPLRLTRNALPPPVHIEEVVANRTRHAPADGLRLPALTSDLEITYTALSLVVPQRVRFRYQLEGHDHDWIDPGTRRQAVYNDLRPGPYRFRVIAANNDGVWNESGATLTFTVAPAWYQTVWFRIIVAALAIAAVWSIHRLRMRQIAATLGARFDERLAERTRLSRELHDTLLQTIQASKMVAEDALREKENAPALYAAVARLSAWLGQAVGEGRTALSSMRSPATARNDLVEDLRQAADECGRGAVEIACAVRGESRAMHPIARDEVYRAGCEAIRNACRHAAARSLEIEVTYGADFRLRIRDDGRGMDMAVAQHGREGHFGILSMRERAAAVGGTLTVNSAVGAGTEITLTVPGRTIYRTIK